MLLYGHPLSGNAHKVRLLLAQLALAYEERTVDLAAAEHRQPAFLALNPRGQVPVLVDGEVAIHDAQAILVYLARAYDPRNRWLPGDPAGAARVIGWLAFAANEIQNGPHAVRFHRLL